MSSLRRVQSSKANGALSKGPSTPAGKERSSLNALRHGLCAKCIVLDHESRENFLTLLQQHVDRFRPANEVEFGMIEEMCASYWRQRRAWSIETALLNTQIALQPDGADAGRMAKAFDTLAAAPTLPLLHRYETRQHLMYQRALRTFAILRTVAEPNEPNPISGQSAPVIPMPTPEPAAPGQPPAKPAEPPLTPAAPKSTAAEPPLTAVEPKSTPAETPLTPAGPNALPAEPSREIPKPIERDSVTAPAPPPAKLTAKIVCNRLMPMTASPQVSPGVVARRVRRPWIRRARRAAQRGRRGPARCVRKLVRLAC
jgi:hypothetical protein